MKKFRFWLARLLPIFYIAFLSLFALDTFEEGIPLFQLILEFLIHLLPSFILLAFLIVAWKRPQVGGWLFLLAAILFTIFFDTYEDLVGFCILSGPLILISILLLTEKPKA